MTKPITPDVILRAKELYEAIHNIPWEKASVLIQMKWLENAERIIVKESQFEMIGMIADVTEMISLSKDDERV